MKGVISPIFALQPLTSQLDKEVMQRIATCYRTSRMAAAASGCHSGSADITENVRKRLYRFLTFPRGRPAIIHRLATRHLLPADHNAVTNKALRYRVVSDMLALRLALSAKQL